LLVSAAPAPWRIAALASGLDAASLSGPAPDGRIVAGTMRGSG
jgi:hypothetical protein